MLQVSDNRGICECVITCDVWMLVEISNDLPMIDVIDPRRKYRIRRSSYNVSSQEGGTGDFLTEVVVDLCVDQALS